MELIYGTTNRAKLTFMRRCVATLGIKLLGLGDIGVSPPDVEEDGVSPLENARIKAIAYYRALNAKDMQTGATAGVFAGGNIPIFALDSGLYIDGLDDTRQPGVHVRNVNGRRLNDDEMIAHYTALARELGGDGGVSARFRNGICLVLGEDRIYEHMGEDIASNRFILATKPHARLDPGFPLDSLSVEIASGKYYHDLDINADKYSDRLDSGFASFFRRALSL